FVQPAAVEAHKIMEGPRRGGERVLQKRRVSGGQRSRLLWLLVQFIQENGKNEAAGIVMRGVAQGKILHGIRRVLEYAGGVGHAQKVVQLQLRQFARLQVERFGRK